MSETTCPACHRKAIYIRSLDRFMHTDGTENHRCWVRIVRGEIQDPSSNEAE